MLRKEGFVFGVLILFSLGIVCAAAVENSLHLTIQTTNATGVTTGTFDFVFNISNSSDCSNVVYSNSATLTTDNRGIISYYLEDVILDFSVQYWLCYYRDAVLINATKLARTPYSFSLGSSTSSAIPAGMIAPFNLTECPTGWTLANGSNGTPDLRGIFIRGSGTNSILSMANGTAFSSIFGSYVNDSFQGHKHDAYGDAGVAPNNYIMVGGTAAARHGYTEATIVTDGTNGIPRTGVETTPAYYSTIYCVKTTEDSAPSNSIWGVTGNYISVQNTSKNVGIGTSTPSSKLQVVGDVNITGNLSIGAGQIAYNSSANKYYYYNTSSWVEIGSGASSSGNYINSIVESGNNSNGYYMKFIDGTMIQWGMLNLGSIDVSTAYGNLFRSSSSYFVTYPANFIEPTFSILNIANSSVITWTSGTLSSLNLNNSQTFYIIKGTTGTGISVIVSWYAVGKWTNTPYDNSTITVGGGIPSGAIVPFNRTSCPVGWTLADGSSGTPDLRGIFIRGSGTNSILKYANGTYYSIGYGTYGNDSLQGHGHYLNTYYNAGGFGYNDPARASTGTVDPSQAFAQLPATISAYGTVRYSVETTPAYYSTIYCVKMTEDTSDSNTIWATSGSNVLLSNSSMNVNLTNNLSIQGTFSAPTQPIISGQVGNAGNVVGAQIVPFNEFWVSQGITYNSSTRRFTVPVDGIYRITLNPFFMTGYGGGRILIGVNNDTPTASNNYGHAYRESATHDTGCINSVVRLNASDYVVFYLAAGALYNQPTDRFNQFSIEKIA